mmetsp:Transcript_5769/g.11853  ORF Transcript_5769/g.11853 Transcript_5769/m.11853 type:complete len:116 (-) Transcript_5769:199-546(-)|eukprot:CAMPEP_0171488108 /NCGR_PEP_ID=MMETSP0958-20121227/2027_1 /TAXON_ID=87120 /ORGANISM="Aurantiochytrium limacinum, Strain ATCCMYA-1381" /LENGTH=115 /DNA_ID=CAMNT_0012021191 /DNA_START=56 /DNA_END=403 /DNA_ORIENTATION=-
MESRTANERLVALNEINLRVNEVDSATTSVGKCNLESKESINEGKQASKRMIRVLVYFMKTGKQTSTSAIIGMDGPDNLPSFAASIALYCPRTSKAKVRYDRYSPISSANARPVK